MGVFCPLHLSSLIFPPFSQGICKAYGIHRAHSYMWSGGVPDQSCRVAPWPTPPCLSVWMWVWVWCVHAGPSACSCKRNCRLRACACQEPRKVPYACEALCPVCHVRTDLLRRHSQWSRGRNSVALCSNLKGRVSCLLLVCSSRDGWGPPGHTCHLPALLPAEPSIARHRLPGTPGTVCSRTPCRRRSSGGWRGLASWPLCDGNGPLLLLRKPPSVA